MIRAALVAVVAVALTGVATPRPADTCIGDYCWTGQVHMGVDTDRYVTIWDQIDQHGIPYGEHYHLHGGQKSEDYLFDTDAVSWRKGCAFFWRGALGKVYPASKALPNGNRFVKLGPAHVRGAEVECP